MEENNQNIKKKNPFIVIVSILLIISIGCAIYGYLNKDNDTNINSNETSNTASNNVDDGENIEDNIEENNQTNSTSIISTEVNDEPSSEDEILEDDGSENKELLTKKDSSYEYSYYQDDEEEANNEVVSFKINNKEVIEEIGFVSEISEIKKYNDFIAIKANYVATCGPDHNDLFIFDYKGNLLFKSGSISIEDLNRIKSDDSDEKWEKGYMTFDNYSYDDSKKQLNVAYLFNINTVLGDCVGDGKLFCEVSKNNTIYTKITLTSSLKNGIFEKEQITEKKAFSIKDFDTKDLELYNSYCK